MRRCVVMNEKATDSSLPNLGILANEGLLRELDLGTPQEAIGKTIYYNDSRVRILGVVKDFIDIGLTKKIFNSFVFVFPEGLEEYKSLAVKLRSSNLPAN